MTLADYIEQHRATPFAWGTHDCVRFAAGWLNQIAGRDLLAGLPGWSTDREGLRLLKSINRAGGMEKLLDERLTRIDAPFALDGAVTLINDTLWLFSGAHIVAPGKAELVFRTRGDAPCAWRV